MIEGSILAMIGMVTVVAGLATLATRKLYQLFSYPSAKPRDQTRALQQWRSTLEPMRLNLIRLDKAELDLLARDPEPDKRLPSGRDREAGRLQSIYGEAVAYYVRQRYTQGKHAGLGLLMVLTKTEEFVYRTSATGATQIEHEGQALGTLDVAGHLQLTETSESVRLVAQSDQRTVHVDLDGRTLGILYRPEVKMGVVPRAFEFTAVDAHPKHRTILEAMAYYYVLSA